MAFAASVLVSLVLLVANPLLAQEDEAGKQKIMDNLRQSTAKTQAESGVAADLAPAESVCGNPTATITECRRAARSVTSTHDTAVKNKPEEDPGVVVYQGGGSRRRPVNPRPVPLPRKR